MQVRITYLIPLALLIVVGCGPKPVTGAGDDNPLVGQAAPDFEVTPFGKKDATQTLKALRGKVVIMDFWATWCGPCKMLTPYIDKVYKKYHDQGVEAMAITTDPADKVAPFEKATPHAMPVYLDPLYVASNVYKIEGIPTVVVIDRNGNVVYIQSGFSEPGPDPHSGPQGMANDAEAAVKQALSS